MSKAWMRYCVAMIKKLGMTIFVNLSAIIVISQNLSAHPPVEESLSQVIFKIITIPYKIISGKSIFGMSIASTICKQSFNNAN